MTQEIELTRGMVALVDDDDFEELNTILWRVTPGGKTYYATTNVGKTTISMHRMIMNAPSGMQVDHINRNGLDNRRSNLRICTPAENLKNTGVYKNSRTGFKGVHKSWICDRYYAKIKLNNVSIYLGIYGTPEEAARAYDEASRKYHGEFGFTNFNE